MTEPTIQDVKRYDLLPTTRCGQTFDEMELSDDGEWVRWEDIKPFLTRDRSASALQQNEELERLRDVVTRAYAMAQDNHSAQCFCFTSAPEQLRRDAHQVARDGLNELAAVLGVEARPILKAEYEEARRAALPPHEQTAQEKAR